MALSSSPADPPSSTTAAAAAVPTAATTTTPRLFTNPRPPTSPFPQPPPHYHHRAAAYSLPSQQPQQQQPLYASQPFSNLTPRGVLPTAAAANRGTLYPVASSGRGFLPKPIRPSQSTDHTVTVASNHGGFPPRPMTGAPYGQTVRAFGFPHSDPHGHLIRPPPHLQYNFIGSTGGGGGGVMPGTIKGVPVTTYQKVALSQPSVSDCNGYKDQRDRSRDDTFATVRDRKVRICEGSSLYALCRSWLRNGFPEETQTQFVDGVKSLPKPSPTPMVDAPVRKEGDKEEEEERSVENLSPKDLLQRHVKRAKRVRARLREERLQRIARYKTRLALLLPPLAEQQQFRNDTAASN